MTSGQPLFRLQTDDASLRHLEVVGAPVASVIAGAGGPGHTPTAPSSPRILQWTPRAIKMAQEAGLDHANVSDIEATGPGGRVSGDDVVKYLAGRK